MALNITTSLSQKLVLTPQLRQRIEMLQMNSIELQDLIQQEINSNPVLETVEPYEETMEVSENILDQYAEGSYAENASNADNSSAPNKNTDAREGSSDDASYSGSADENYAGGDENFSADENFSSDDSFSADGAPENNSSDPFEEIDYGREFQEYLDPGYRTQEYEHREDEPSFELFLSRPKSLSDHLTEQVILSPMSDEEDVIADFIIGNLDADGRLTVSEEEIAEECRADLPTVEKVRQFILTLDPVGCAARDVRECLLAQIRAGGNGERLAARLIQNHFSELQPHRLLHLSKDVGETVEILNEELKYIRTLNPYPGRRYANDDAIHIAPEVYIEKIGEDYVIHFNDDGSPRLRISKTYQEMIEKGQASKETRDFLKDNMRSAVDLLRNIEHRRQTIYKVVECIVLRQREFLEKGVQFLRPMMLKDVAEDIGMHLSTISRVVNRKYAHTPQGVIELRRFFSEGMINEDGEEVSTRIIKLRIKKLVEEEDQKKPITDDEIAKILLKEGTKLSRRTVAKYRDQMNIPGSRERKVVI